MTKSYGQALGDLIAQKRKILGLTQTQLSEDAFGSSAKTRRISELENGTVANPHPKTIDPIIVELGISEEELANCAASSNSQPDGDLEEAYREASQLLRKTAENFEHANPDASLQELHDFLKGKAQEYLELRARIQQIETVDEELNSLVSDALQALSNAEFDKVDDVLKIAEEIHLKEQTISQIEKLAWVRVLRGDAMFLGDMPEKCVSYYKDAASFFVPFDVLKSINLLEDLAGRIYETSRRSIEPKFNLAEQLLEYALELANQKKESIEYGRVNYRISLIQRNRSIQLPKSERTNLLRSAEQYARTAIKVLTRTDDWFSLVSAQMSLANSLYDRHKAEDDNSILEQVLTLQISAKDTIRKHEEGIRLLGNIYNNIGSTMITMAQSKSNTNFVQLNEARKNFAKSIEFSEQTGNVEIWSGANMNFAQATYYLSKNDDLEESTKFLYRLRAISCAKNASAAMSFDAFPAPQAEIHRFLGSVIFEHALDEENDIVQEAYFAQAIAAFEQSLALTNPETQPSELAFIHCRLGSIFSAHSMNAEKEVAEHDLGKAVDYFREAAKIYSQVGEQDNLLFCNEYIAKLEKAAFELQSRNEDDSYDPKSE
ncbi:transcriptional regulator with XRE-family HTH domain [Labrenzia sp. EL_142]|nr:transcriptional regulator with XRE-family HTH domain [Labrenzia sp. EL_142]